MNVLYKSKEVRAPRKKSKEEKEILLPLHFYHAVLRIEGYFSSSISHKNQLTLDQNAIYLSKKQMKL